MISFFFFFNDTATTEIYTLSLHDALPIAHPRVQLSPHRGNPPPRVGHRQGARAQAVGAQRLARGGGEPRARAPRGLLRLARGSARAVSLPTPLGKVLGPGRAKRGGPPWG